MKLNKDGSKHRHTLNAQHFTYIPTPPAKHMAETCEALLVRLTGIVGQKFAPLYPESNYKQVIAELEKLQRFCEEKIGTPTHDPNN